MPTPLLDPSFERMLAHLHRAGRYGYWWTLEDKKSLWWPIGYPSELPSGTLNIYYGVHPTLAARGDFERARLSDIAAINCVCADFDAKDFGDKAATLTHVQALTIAPSVIVDSGGGYHGYWLLRDTFILATDSDRERARLLQANWVSLVGGDHGAKDLARVLRVPGTRNYKPQYAPDFPLVEFVQADFERIYTLEELEHAAAHLKSTASTPTPAGKTNGNGQGHDPYATAALRNEIGALMLATEGHRNTQLNRSAFAMGQLVSAGILDQCEVETQLLNSARAIGLGEREALATIQSGIEAGLKSPRQIPDRKNEHGNGLTSEPENASETLDLDALIAALAEQPQDVRDEQQLRQLFLALSKLDEFALARYQSTVTEKLGLTAREFRRLLNAVIRETHKQTTKQAPPEIVSERYPIVRPALDFVDGLAVVTVPVLMLVDHKPVYRPSVVTSTRETLMLDEPGLMDIGGRRVLLTSAPQVIDDVARWDWPDVQKFVQGDSPDPVETFLSVEGVYAKYLDFCEPYTSDVLTIWDMGTYLHELFDTYAYIHVTGPSQSGKTKTVDVTQRIAFNMQSSSSISAAALYRVLQATHGSLAIDEAERLANPQDPKGTDLRLLLDAGYKKGSPVLRYNADTDRVESFQVYGPKMIANIKGLGEVLESRCIVVRMLRTTTTKGRLKVNDQCEPWADIRHRLYCFALTHFAAIREIYRNDASIQILENRTNELWQPLLAIAAFLSRYPGGPSDLLAHIIEFAKHKADQASRSGLDDWEEALLLALEKLTAAETQPSAEFGAKAIREAMTGFLSAEEVSEIKAQWIGYALRRFGLLADRERKKHGADGRHYVIVRSEVLDLIQRYGVGATNENRK